MIKMKFSLIFLLVTIPFIGFAQEFYKRNMDNLDSLAINLHGTYQILEIHIYKKNEIRKYTHTAKRKTKKRFKKKKVFWITEKQGKIVEAYIIKVSDSTNSSYYIASLKTESTSKEKIMIGNKYLMELNMIIYLGEVHGIHFGTIGINNGTSIPLPREAKFYDIYISPNLQGLYYVK